MRGMAAPGIDSDKEHTWQAFRTYKPTSMPPLTCCPWVSASLGAVALSKVKVMAGVVPPDYIIDGILTILETCEVTA